MRLFSIPVLMMTFALHAEANSFIQQVPCEQTIIDAAKAFAPSLSGGRCYGFIEEEGSLKEYNAVEGAYSIRVHTPNGSCSHLIWVKVDSTCRLEGVGQAK